MVNNHLHIQPHTQYLVFHHAITHSLIQSSICKSINCKQSTIYRTNKHPSIRLVSQFNSKANWLTATYPFRVATESIFKCRGSLLRTFLGKTLNFRYFVASIHNTLGAAVLGLMRADQNVKSGTTGIKTSSERKTPSIYLMS